MFVKALMHRWISLTAPIAFTALLVISSVGQAEEPAIEPATQPDGAQLVRDNCLQCHRSDNPKYPEHNLGWILRKRYDKAAWADNVARMETLSLRDEYITEPWSKADKDAMTAYLAEQTYYHLNDFERLGMMHYSVVHFPVGLICVVGFFEVIGLLARWPMKRDLLHALAWLAFISTFVAVALGFILAWDVSTMSETLADHRTAGLFTLGFIASALFFRELAASFHRPGPTWAYRFLLLMAIVAVGATGHLGGLLVHGEYLPFFVTG